MAIFTIFWCAVLGIFFWLFSMLLKSIQNAINAIIEAVTSCVSIVIVGMIGVVIMCALYNLAANFRLKGFWEIIGGLIYYLILVGISFALLAWAGAAIFQVANIIVSVVVGIILAILEGLNPAVENTYAFFLKKIKQKVDLL